MKLKYVALMISIQIIIQIIQKIFLIMHVLVIEKTVFCKTALKIDNVANNTLEFHNEQLQVAMMTIFHL